MGSLRRGMGKLILFYGFPSQGNGQTNILLWVPFTREWVNEYSFMGSLRRGMGKRIFFYGFPSQGKGQTNILLWVLFAREWVKEFWAGFPLAGEKRNNLGPVFPSQGKSEIILGRFSLRRGKAFRTNTTISSKSLIITTKFDFIVKKNRPFNKERFSVKKFFYFWILIL
jgi:hypothetical protein